MPCTACFASATARTLQSNVRKSDLLGRIGGEEFAVLMPVASKPVYERIAETVIAEVRGLASPHERNADWGVVTTSVGGAFIDAADYIAKNSPYKPYTDGRITVIAATAPPAGETTEPAAAATAPAAPAAEAPASASTATEAAVATAATVYKVVAGDSLWKIAEATYGGANEWLRSFLKDASRDPRMPNVQFTAQVDAGDVPAGRHWLGLRVTGGDGSVETWAEQPVDIQ